MMKKRILRFYEDNVQFNSYGHGVVTRSGAVLGLVSRQDGLQIVEY